MQATEVRYMRRFNLENYQHEEIEIRMSLTPGDMPGDALKYAAQVVELSSIQDRRTKAVLDSKIEQQYKTLAKQGVKSDEYF